MPSNHCGMSCVGRVDRSGMSYSGNGHISCCSAGMSFEHPKPHIPGTIPEAPPEPRAPVDDPDPADTPDEQPRDD